MSLSAAPSLRLRDGNNPVRLFSGELRLWPRFTGGLTGGVNVEHRHSGRVWQGKQPDAYPELTAVIRYARRFK